MKRTLFFIGILLMVLGLAGCRVVVKESPEETPYRIYDLNSEETALVTTPFTPDEEAQKDLFQYFLQCLDGKSSTTPVINLLPAEVTISSYERTDSSLIIDFNSAYHQMRPEKEALVRAGIAKTFLQLEEIETVSFTVNGSELTDYLGNPMGSMVMEDFIDSESDSEVYERVSFTLYFADSTGQNLTQETRSAYYRRNLRVEEVVLQQLIRGPMTKDCYPSLNDHTLVRSLDIFDGICYVDLGGDFLDSSLKVDPKIVIRSIVDTILAVSDAAEVLIRVDGSSDCSLGDLSLNRYFHAQDLE